MSRMKKKEVKQERLAIKDFFDRILPGVLKFYSDHYICGDSYRCVWAIKEYPPSTEEQAILRQLADRTHVTLRIYNRLVDHAEQHRIIQNANRRNRLRFGGDDIQEMVDAEHNLKDVKQLLTNLRTNGETLLHTAVFIELKAADMDKLRELQSDVMMELTRCKISVDRLTLRQLDGFLSVLPFGYNHFGSQYERVLPASSVANLYPFNYSGKTDPHGFYLGRDKQPPGRCPTKPGSGFFAPSSTDPGPACFALCARPSLWLGLRETLGCAAPVFSCGKAPGFSGL